MNADENKIQPTKRGRWKLFLVILICASPVLFSYLSYYLIQPTGRTNYGSLLDPRLYPMPKLLTELTAYKGKWIMLQVSSGDCQMACRNSLLNMRQLRLMQGKERNRIERVMLLTDQHPVDPGLLRDYEGTHFLRVDANVIAAWLPVEPDDQVQDRIYLIDPLGNLMMRYRVDADPNKIKKDMTKLLKASGIG